jgi:hypothetical protein
MSMGKALALSIFFGVLAFACSTEDENPGRDRRGGPGDGAVAPPTVDEAAKRYPDFATLWTNSLARTCGPNNGVCHQDKQFPHMEREPSLFAGINGRCNQLRIDRRTIQNICEPTGDTLRIGAFSSVIGNVTPKPSEVSPTTLEITLRDPAPDALALDSAVVVRKRPGVPDTEWPLKDAVKSIAGKTIVVDYDRLASVGGYSYGVLQRFLWPQLYLVDGDDAQVELGDPNGDGFFGADLGGALIKPQKPLESYFMLRLLAPLPQGQKTTSLTGQAGVVEPQMPIANFTHWDGVPSIVAAWCWIAGLAPDASNADAPIDYEHCDLAAMPPPVVADDHAVSWSAIYEGTLKPRCSSCHNTKASPPSKLVLDDPGLAYATLLGINGARPSQSETLPFVTPGDSAKSYLYLKLSPTPPSGAQMPSGGALPEAAVTAIKTWIDQGAAP